MGPNRGPSSIMSDRGSKRPRPSEAPPERANAPPRDGAGEGEIGGAEANSRPPGRPAERRLETILRAIPTKELDGLAERIGVKVDPQKRIDKPGQVARALVRLPDAREPGRLPGASGELLRRIAEAGGSLVVGAVPVGLELLVRSGLVFARMADEELAQWHREKHGSRASGQVIELVVPTAYLVQMRANEGDDPRSLRALLAEAPFETASAIATHYLGRPSTPPVALSLEQAWEVLGDPALLALELSRLSLQERRVLEKLEQVGGEVDTQELMDLEREPMRLRGAHGVAAGRRGAAFSLEKRGFLFPIHPNRYVLPTEVAALVGADRMRDRERRREEIRSQVTEDDHLPRRARFSLDPTPLALALAITARESGVAGEIRSGVGTPRSLVARLAHRFGRTPEETALLVAASRAIGLWGAGAVSAVSPPGTLAVGELTRSLFEAWRRGGTWDEARVEAEMLRLPIEARDASPVCVLREIVLDALVDLSEGQWAPYSALAAYIDADPRTGGLHRLFARWAKRVDLPVPAEAALVRRILLESLPALGVVDVGGAVTEASSAAELPGVAIRLTFRGRELATAGATPAREEGHASRGAGSDMVERRLRVGAGARVAEVLDLTSFVDVVGIEPSLELEVTAAAVGRGLSLGIDALEMRRRLEALASVPEPIARWLQEAGTIVGQSTFTSAGGFLWVDDPEVREMLRTRPGASDMFLDPSPLGGLLVAPGVESERLIRRCRALGVEVAVDEPVARVRRSTAPPPHTNENTRKAVSWRPPPLGAPPGSRD